MVTSLSLTYCVYLLFTAERVVYSGFSQLKKQVPAAAGNSTDKTCETEPNLKWAVKPNLQY